MLIQGTGNDWESWTIGLLVGHKEVNFIGGLAYGISSATDHKSEEVFSGRVSDICLWGGTKHSSSVKRSPSKRAESLSSAWNRYRINGTLSLWDLFSCVPYNAVVWIQLRNRKVEERWPSYISCFSSRAQRAWIGGTTGECWFKWFNAQESWLCFS